MKVGAIALVALFFGHQSTAQNQAFNPADLGVAYAQIQISYESERYIDGLRMVEEVLKYWGDRPADAVGDRFGHFFYIKGLLHMGVGQFERATDAFKECYEEYPDTRANLFIVHAKAQQGACLLILEDYESAIEILKVALAEAPNPNEGGGEPEKALIALNLARAYLKNDDIKEGLSLLYKALDNPSVKPEHRESAFMIAAEIWSPTVPFEQVRDFIDEYGEIVRNSPIERRRPRNPIFQHLGRELLSKNEPLGALMWYAQSAPPSEVLAWHEAKLEDIKRRKPDEEHPNFVKWENRMQLEYADLERAKTECANLLYGTGAAHYRLENHPASFTVFRHLADEFPNHSRQAEVLFNTVASGVKIEFWPEVRTYGLRFLDRFPDHRLTPQVASVMVESVFGREDYEQSWATAQEVRLRFPIGSNVRDVPDFVAGASLFHLEKFREARVELEAYTIHYPDGGRLEPVRYYLGAVNAKEFRWQKAATIFDAFLADYPESEMRPGVLYLNGVAHYALGKYPRSLELATLLQLEFPEAPEIPASWNLTGDVLDAFTPRALVSDIENAYLKAQDLAAKDDSEIAAYALWKLIALKSGESKVDETVAYFDEFQAEHEGSVYRLDALAGALEALHEKERTHDAIRHLEENIKELDPSSPDFDALFGTYFSYIDQCLSPDEAVSTLQKFSISSPNEATEKWLQIAEIGRAESRSKNASEVENLYQKLDVESASPFIPNFGLIKLARYHRAKEHNARAREVYLDLIENRPDRGHLETAVLDLAVIDSESDDPSLVASAFENFSRIIDDFGQPELYEPAIMGLARIHFDQGNFAEAETFFGYYLAQNHWTLHRAEADFKLGRCYEENGKTNEAIKLYAITYVNFPGNLDWSTQAYLRAAELLKKQDRDRDALLVMVDFLKRLGHLEHPNIREGRKIFAEWKADWVAENQTADKKS